MKHSRKTAKTFGNRIIDALNDLNEALESGKPLSERFTVRTVQVAEPQRFTAHRVRQIRQRLGLSQAVFAKLLGISKVLEQSWEQGTRQPSALARRLLADIERDPAHWSKLIVRIQDGPATARPRKSA